jgi:iron(III) transport system ATP-binding protein
MQVSLDKINLGFGGQPLFRQLDLVVPSGKFVTLLGPSGCGKTSLLRMLGGFVLPDSGRVLFGSDDVTRVPAHRRGVGMVFQDYALFPDRSVLANVSYGLAARNVPKPLARERALAMLRRVGLHEFSDRAPAQLSGGQRQRVAMARALVIEPRLLLLDEPLSALDAKLRIELRGMIKELQAETATTTVFVTHDQEEALALSDLIAVMNHGQIVQWGSPRSLYEQPRTAFAADFLGGANLIPIQEELAATSAARRLLTPGGVLVTRSEVPLRSDAHLAVRREDISISDPRPPGDGEMAGVIHGVEFRGGVTGYTVSTAAGPIRVDVWTSQHRRLRQCGEAVVLELPSSAHIVARA